MKIIISVFLVLLSFTPASAQLVEEEILYKLDGLEMKGFLVYDKRIKGKRPGVIVVHEWWGQNDYPRDRAKELAKLGYTAFAADMYGEGKVANHPKEAGAFSSAVLSDIEKARDRFYAAYNVLKKDVHTDPDNISAIGYCFGGSVVLEMARLGTPLRGVVSFHGGLKTEHPAQPGMVASKVLVLHGAADKFIPTEDIEKFKVEMENAGADMKFVSYPGAKHGFSNPEADAAAKKFKLPLGYNRKVAKQAWAEMEKFLKKVSS